MPSNWQRPQIPWKRFWCRFGGAIHIGNYSQGFLTDPEGQFTKAYNPNLLTLEELLVEPFLILCGDPGIGKSTVVRQAENALKRLPGDDGYLITLDFRDIPNELVFAQKTFHSAEWLQWRNSGGKLVLVVDGIDEGLLKIPGFVSYLASQLRQEPVERLKLILACRSAEWPVHEGKQLISLWNGIESPIYELCPLRQCDAALAAEKWGLDKEIFIEGVYDQKAVALAALPTTLFFLLDEFRENGGFRGTHRELYERGCQRLAREADPRRTEILRQLRKTARVSPPQEVCEAAIRLAALLLTCRKSAIHTGPLDETEAGSDLHISEAADTDLPEDVILDAISTGLCTSRGPSRFGFAHQTFAECLASQYLARLPLPQVRGLLCAFDGPDEHVVPQLAETAAWVAGAREDFFDYLCRIEPEVLLRSDISKVQNQRKSVLVTAVLEKAKRVELFDELNISRFFNGLKHPTLADQLQPYIADRSLHTVVRRMAMSIAGDCKESGVADILLQVVRDATEDQHIRDQAAHALEELMPNERSSELVPLALGRVGADPDNTIRGCAIRKLVPAFWSVSQALPAIRTPRNDRLHSSYWSLLKFHLPNHLNEADLPKVLTRMIRWTHCFDSLSWFKELAEVAFAMALKSLDKPDVRRVAVRVWLIKLQHHHPLPDSQSSPFVKLIEADENARRDFTSAVLDDPATPPDDFRVLGAFHAPIFPQGDLEWALNQIALSPIDRRSAWAHVICRSASPEVASLSWDLLLRSIEQIPELKAKFAWLRAWELEEPMARKEKARWLREKRWKKRLAQPKQAFDVEGSVSNALEAILNGKTFQWIGLCELLSIEDGQSRFFRPLAHDITEFPGWKRASDVRRNEIRAAARSFLLNHSDGYAQIGNRTNYCDPGYIAIWLLRDEARQESALKEAVATNWIEALVGYFNNGSENFQETAALAYGINPDATLRAYVRETKEDDLRHGRIHCQFGFQKAWDSKFTVATLDLIRAGTLKDESVESLLTFLGPLAPTEAAACAKELLTPTIVANPELLNRTTLVLASCIGVMLAATWDIVWPIIESDVALAKRVLLQVAERYSHNRTKLVPTLSEHQLAALYLKLHNLFPPETDPPHTAGFAGVSPRRSVSWLRDEVLAGLEARGTAEACSELLQLAIALPKHAVWFRWRYYNARTSKRRLTWSPPSPQSLLLLIKNRDGRLVRNAQDLLEVVLESLERLQSKLTHITLPRSEIFWRYQGADTRQRNFEPHDEAFLSNEIARWLRDDLNQRGIVIGREVQPRRGQRTDIYVEAVAKGASEPDFRTVTIVIEVKGCWNPDVKTAAESQLVNDYMRLNGLTHGIYLVGWFICDVWKDSRNKLASGTFGSARQEVAAVVSAYDGKVNPEVVKGVLLDCTYPASVGA